MQRLIIKLACVLALGGCTRTIIVEPCADAGAPVEADAALPQGDAGECAPDVYEPDDVEPYWTVLSDVHRRQLLPGTWHDDGPDRVKATVPQELSMLDGQVFTFEAEGAAELRMEATCVVGEWTACSGELFTPQICRASHIPAETGGSPTVEIEGRCSFGAAVLNLEAVPAAGAGCARMIRVEVSR